LAQIERGVKRVSLCVRSIVQLHEPAEIDGHVFSIPIRPRRYRSKPDVPAEKRSAADILPQREKKDTQKLKLS
jgi:hypothetical protein